MKLLKLSFAGLMFLALAACGSSGSESSEGCTASPVLKEGWRTITTNSYFKMNIPSNMEIKTDLNAESDLQYGYVEEVDGVVKELYVIVLKETNEEIEAYDLDMEFDAMSYAEVCIDNFKKGGTEILTKNPKTEKINCLDAVRVEMFKELGGFGVYYNLAVFEGKKGFYQVLTWTIDDQKPDFKADMDDMLNSFVEN